MSEILGEGRVLILPDTTTFRTQLLTQVRTAIAAAAETAVIPVRLAATGGAAGVVAETQALSAAQDRAAASTLGLASASQVERTALGRNAVVLEASALSAQTLAEQESVAAKAAATRAAVTRSAAAAQTAGAAAAHKLAIAQEEVAGASTEVSAAEIRNTRAAAAVAAAERGVQKALAAKNIALIDAASNTLVLAEAEEREALAALTASRTSAALARRQEQFGRALFANTASTLGLRGAVLSASSAFIAGTIATIAIGKSIKGASDQIEELNKNAVIFGDRAKDIEEFARTAATSLGISETEALKATGIFGNLFSSIGLSVPVSARMSERLVQLASDLASFNNASPERTLEALRSGLVGQARPLRVFGIFLSQARAQQEALTETGKKNVKNLTNSELVQARYSLILKDSVLAQGDFARTSDRSANQTRILRANIANLSDELGRSLLPAVESVITGLNTLIKDVGKLQNLRVRIRFFFETHFPGKGGDFLSKLFAGPTEVFGDVQKAIQDMGNNINLTLHALGLEELNKFNQALEDDRTSAGVTSLAVRQLGTDAALASRGIDTLTNSANNAATGLKGLEGAATGLQFQQLKIQTGLAPGGAQAELANLRQQEEQQKKIIAATASGSKARRHALEQLHAIQQQENTLEQQAASDAKQAAKDIQDARDKANQAFLDSFAGGEQRRQNAITLASQTETLNDDIAANRRLRQFFRAEVLAIKRRIQDMRLHGESLQAARDAIRELNQKIFDLRNEIDSLAEQRRANREAAKQAARDARQAHLEALLSIAETTEGTRDDARRIRALEAFDRQQIRRILAIRKRRRLTQEEKAQLDAYRVDLAQQEKALHDLTEQQKKTNVAAKVQFEFLQAQQGFAANLLGNLIPLGATGGLVGGTTAPGTTAPVASKVTGGLQAKTTLETGKDIGPTRIGQQTEVLILREIRHLLRLIHAGGTHPEAHQRRLQNREEHALFIH